MNKNFAQYMKSEHQVVIKIGVAFKFVKLMYLSVEYGGEGVRDLVSHLKGKLRNNDRVWNTNMATVQVYLDNISLGII